VLHPADGDEIFFVARGDGSHYFSVTWTSTTARCATISSINPAPI
jgi:cell division protein YceG involved in septum cleavage